MRLGRSAISKIGLLRTGCRAAFRGVLMKNAPELCDSADILAVSTFFHLCQADSENSRAPFMDNLTRPQTHFMKVWRRPSTRPQPCSASLTEMSYRHWWWKMGSVSSVKQTEHIGGVLTAGETQSMCADSSTWLAGCQQQISRITEVVTKSMKGWPTRIE